MSEPTPDRPTMDDDLDQAYARSHALADDGRGPAASVRANVLAAAALVAAGRDAQAAVPPLVPVAPPVADVGRGRDRAINLSSWRVRSGAALCALLLVCLGIWRFDESGRLNNGVQVALAELRLAEPRNAPAPQDLPLPAASPASVPYAAPPPVVVDPLDNSGSVRGGVAKRADRDKDVVVAQLDEQRAAAPRTSGEVDGVARARAAQPGVAHVPAADAAAAAAPPPVALASNAPAEQAPATVTITAAAPAVAPPIMTLPSHPPSALPRRVMLVPRPPAQATAASVGNTVIASADTDDTARANAAEAKAKAPEVRVAAAPAAPIARSAAPDAYAEAAAKPDARLASGTGAARSANADVAGAYAYDKSPSTLAAAADRGDVDALKALLAEPSVRVDAPDAQGRTALLHAVVAQHLAAVRLLLAAGADPGRADHAGLTPLQAAQTGASAEIAALLAAPR